MSEGLSEGLSAGDAARDTRPQLPGGSEPTGGQGPARKDRPDPAVVLLAVERVAADVTALGRAVAAQPEEVAARLDVDAATAAIGVRVGALGSALDQLRLSLLAAISRLADDDRIDQLVAAVAAVDPSERLARVEQAIAELADGVRAGGAIADALDQLGQRMASIEDAAARMAGDAEALVQQVGPVPDRLSAIASQVDRITPLARAGDQAGTMFDRLERVSAGLEEVMALLQQRATGTDRADGQDEDEDDERFEAVVDVLAGVTRRQDQVTDAIASVLDQVRGPEGVDAVLERMEQLEHSLAARLDRLDGELRGQGAALLPSSAEGAPRPDSAGGAAALEAVLQRVQEQERTLASHLDWVGERLAEVAAHLVPDEAADHHTDQRFAAVVDTLVAVAARQDELAEVFAKLVERDHATGALVEQLAGLAERQDELTAAIATSGDEERGPMAVAAVFDRMEQRERSIAARLDRIDLQLRRTDPAAGGQRDEAFRPGAEDVAADREAALSLASSVESIATVTENLAALVEATSERLDRRLSAVEAAVEKASRRAAAPAPRVPAGPPPPSPSADAAALRLAELRAERARVQARLQEERLLAAQARHDEP